MVAGFAAGSFSRANSRGGRTKTVGVPRFEPGSHIGVMIVEGCGKMLVVLQTRSVCLSYLDSSLKRSNLKELLAESMNAGDGSGRT